jgi:hypothetical protein
MARIKKYGLTYAQPLSAYATFIKDTVANSQYFRVTEFKETFTGGKNGFLIEGCEHLMQSTEVQIQVLDVEGNALYVEIGNGIPEYYEGTSKLISVYVYEDTPAGPATITILGELKTYLDEGGVVREVPDEWKNNYNIKWQKSFNINTLLRNEDKVRFYRRPKVDITEIVKPIFSAGFSNVTNTGLVTGTPIAPRTGEFLSDFKQPTSYRLQTTNSAFTGSMEGNLINIPSLAYSPVISEVINKNEIVVTQPYIDASGVVAAFTNRAYNSTFSYVEGASNIASALTGSFAKIKLTDLTAFVGDVARVKIFRKSQSDVTDYQFVQEIVLESNELLLDLETTTKNQEVYGIFTQDIIKDYWVTSSNSISAQFNQSFLFNSAKLDSPTTNYFYTTKSLAITKDAEYNLNFNVRLSENASPNNYIKAFLSGSKQSTNGVVQVNQPITTITSTNFVLQKSTNSDNIIAEEIDNARLYFEVKGSGWHIANVSFVAAQETSFSPDEITFIQPVPRTLPEETFNYRFEFYDINNNYIPVLVEQTKTFDGGNLQRLQKGLVFNPKYLYFTFDSGSNPVEPTVVGFSVTKNLLTGSVTYTSQSFDFFGNELFASDYTASVYAGPDPLYSGSGQYPGLLDDIKSDNPTLKVANFTGSRSDINIQLIKIKGECEGFEDTVIISKILDGFGGVNHIIRPYRGVDIRNSSTQSLEVQAVRIDGINDIILNSSAVKNFGNIQLHVLSASLDPLLEPERFVNLMYVTQSNFIKGLTTGSLGSRQINYNATFNRDSIDKRLTLYLMPSSSAAGVPAFIASSSVLTSIVLSDFQDGLDAGFVAYDTDVFNINFRNSLDFIPGIANVTGSFFVRGRNTDPLTSSLSVYPSMSINKDFIPEYWVYYVTHSSTWNKDISIVATDDDNNIIPSQAPNPAYGNYVRSSLNQSKTLTIAYTYTEPYTSASVSVDKTFTIIPAGKPGDESIIFEINPASVSLKANPKGIVNSYSSSVTDIRLKQGSRYLIYTASRKEGTFYIAQSSITSSNIMPGFVINPTGPGFNKDFTGSLFIGTANSLTNLSGSVTYPLEIQPYYTSSVYTASVIQTYTKILDGPPPIEVIISPAATAIQADEVGFVSPAGYAGANTTIKVREGNDYLIFTTQSMAPGTFRIQTGGSVIPSNIMVETITSSLSRDTGIVTFNRFDYPYVSSSIQYNVVVNPYSLTNGHVYTSSVIERTQTITKNVAPVNARAVILEATTNTVNFDGDGVVTAPLDPIVLTATATNTTGAVWFNFYKNDDTNVGSGIVSEDFPNAKYATFEVPAEDAVSPGENAKWSVIIRDGNSSPSSPIRATNATTITGIKDGPTAYNVQLTNENSSAIYKVSGQLSIIGTGTQIKATKGDVPLLHKTDVLRGGPGFSPKTTDQFGDEIGSLGEYQVKIFSKSSHLKLAENLSGSQVLSTFNDIATIGDLTGWTTPETYPVAEIVYEVNIENGRLLLYKTQSLSINFEGATGPGIVMRGEWNNTTDYSGSVETQNKRRDAVIYGTSPVTYYAAISGSGPTTYNKSGNLVPATPPTTGGNNAFWEFLGEEEFFVAAKIAIFEESFVKNTINVGNNSGSAFANIVLAGGREDPYMAIGQYANIGYDNVGIWLGIYNDGTGPSQYKPRFSLKNATGTNYLRWTGTALEVSGDLNIVAGGSGNASTQAYANTSASSSAAIALTSAANIANLTASAAFQNAVAKTQQLADGAFPGTFISSNFIYSPVVAGVNGYFSNTFKVGINGITLDGTNKKIYIGTGTYNNANTPFYVDNANKFSLGNKLFFDGNNLTITGRVTADSGNIGGWLIDGTILRDENSNIKLNPSVPAIEIYDDTDVKRLDIRKGALSSPGTSGTVTITPPLFNEELANDTYYSFSWDGVGDYRSAAYNSFTPSTTGTYVNATPSWGYLSPYMNASFGYTGNIGMDIYIEIHNSATPGVGTLVHNIRIGEGPEVTASGDEDGTFTINNPLSLYFVAGVTYYVFVSVSKYGTIIGSSSSFVDLSGMIFTPNAVSLTVGLNQTELTDEGLFVVQDTNKYAKISRASADDFVQISQNSTTKAGINVQNFQGKGNPAVTITKGDIAVLDGRIEFNQAGVDRGFNINWTKGAPLNYEGHLGQVMDAGQLRPSIRFNNIAGVGAVGGAMRGIEISLANGWIGRNTSSRRYKEDIEVWQHPSILDVINRIDVKTFYWKVDADKESRPQNIGLIAEELLEAGLEEYVGMEPDRDENGVEKLNEDGTKIMLPYDVDKTGLVFPLWRAMQELSQKVKDLEDKLNQLNS